MHLITGISIFHVYDSLTVNSCIVILYITRELKITYPVRLCQHIVVLFLGRHEDGFVQYYYYKINKAENELHAWKS